MKLKIFLTSTLVFLGMVTAAWGQTTLISDDFESGNLNSWTDDSTNNWEASNTSSLNGTYSLRHVDNGIAGISILYKSVTATDINTKVTTWQFNMKNVGINPSGGNYYGVALLGNEKNPKSGTFSGYVIGVNFDGTSDELILYKVTNGTYSEVINTGVVWGSSDFFGIKVERNSAGVWQVYYDSDGNFDNLSFGGTATDTDITTYANTSVYFEYTKTNAGNFIVDDILIQQQDDTKKAQPANHVTSFVATGAINSINISWTDATGPPAPDSYLIKASKTSFGDITAPTDKNAESDDSDLSDGSATLNVLQGTEEASFAGLDELTTYYFKIYPYTNTGSDIDYKTDGSIPQASATTLDAPDIVLNEILADPDASSGDANGDGVISSDDDEFVEFVNMENSNLDITDWYIEVKGSTKHIFPSSTVLKPMQAVVVFGGGTPTGKFGDAIVQTTSSLGLTNSNATITLKKNGGLEILSYAYGSEGGDDQSLTRSPELTGNFVKHETVSNSSYSPGTRADGSTFQPSVNIIGNEGWRMLSAPTSGNTYGDLLGSIWTQGFTGSDYEAADPSDVNVQYFDINANPNEFTAIGDLSDNMTPGQGFITYIYSDDDHTNSPADAGFPKTLSVFGTENSGDVPVTLNSGADAWSLVGNPYASTIEWGLLTKTDITGTVYVYDHSYGTPTGDDVAASGSAGSYRVWNGGTGSLAGGKIAAFQGFWVQNASSGTPGLTIEEADKSSGGTPFYKENNQQPITIKLKGEMDYRQSEAFLSFTDSGLEAKDNFDGLKLTPLDFKDYLSVATLTEDTHLDINNLPQDFERELEIPLSVQAFYADAESGAWKQDGGTLMLSWPVMENIPDDWSFTLHDYSTGTSVNMKVTDSYTFTLEAKEGAQKAMPSTTILQPQPPTVEQSRRKGDSPRFTITVTRGKTSSTQPSDQPEQFALEQNYPNPFNPTTRIQYSVQESGPVTLTVYNVMGQQVETLVSKAQSAGTYRVNWNAANMASGIYYYRLQAGSQIITRQMTLIK